MFSIEVSWIEFGDIQADIADGCWGSSGTCTSQVYWTGFPKPKAAYTIPNLKDFLGTALNDVGYFADRVAVALEAVRCLVDAGDSADVINASAIPIFRLEQSVESMTLVDTAKEVADAEKK